MSKSISLTGSFDLRDTMSDIGLRFVDSPMHRIGFEISEAGVQTLADACRDRIFRANRKAASGALHWHTLLLRFGENTFLVAFGDGRDWAEIFAPTPEEAEVLYTEVAKKLEKQPSADKPFFYMFRYEYSDFLTERVEALPDDPGDEFLSLCYGGDILAWMEQFGERTIERAGGLTILEGPPGTGKTSLISLMIRRLERTHVFYVLPTVQDNTLSAPEFVPFWENQNKRHPDRVKVIVIEDAERLLWRRGGDNREAVSSVLNIADGLIGCMLRVHLICSVNAPLSELDPAIMRPGRLTNQRTFQRLPRHTAMRLAEMKAVPFEPGDNQEDFTLAEILNPGIAPLTVKPVIGFAR